MPLHLCKAYKPIYFQSFWIYIDVFKCFKKTFGSVWINGEIQKHSFTTNPCQQFSVKRKDFNYSYVAGKKNCGTCVEYFLFLMALTNKIFNLISKIMGLKLRHNDWLGYNNISK